MSNYYEEIEMGQIAVEKNDGGIKGRCAITLAVWKWE